MNIYIKSFRDHPEAGNEKQREFNIRFKSQIKLESDQFQSVMKKTLYGHLKLNKFIKNSLEIALFSIDLFGCNMEKENGTHQETICGLELNG